MNARSSLHGSAGLVRKLHLGWEETVEIIKLSLARDKTVIPG